MKCHLVQTTKIADDNIAEKEMLGFLGNLPETCHLYREFKISLAYEEQVKGLEEKRPDFVIVSPRLGVMSIEVKDWNLTTNQYEWVDQYKIRKTNLKGKEEWLTNPVDQASRYLHALIDLLKPQGSNLFVTSFIAFPRLSRAEFGNKISNIEILKNPQSKFYLDLDKTIFKEDLDKHTLNPEKYLIDLLAGSNRSLNYTAKEVDKANRILLPSSFIVGDFSKRQAGQQQLRMMSEKQKEWIFGVDRKTNYLLDVPGSGKTNALISKAIHFVDTSTVSSPKVLITTYSDNLATNIRRIFEQKTLTVNSGARYSQSVIIQSIPDLLQLVLSDMFSRDEIEKHQADKADYDGWVTTNVRDVLSLQPEKFKVFDAVFVDEIQDFDNFYLQILDHFNKGKNYFLVGDIGQKIYDRQFDLQRLGIIPHRVELPKTYQMYRTPKNIAKLAVTFIWKDPHCRYEFEENGYKGDFKYPNPVENIAAILKTKDPQADVVSRIKSFLNAGSIADDILVIGSRDLVRSVQSGLQQENIPCVIGESPKDGFVALVEFHHVKGLEREIVLIAGIESLYDKGNTEGLFWEESRKIKQEGLSRRMIYVAITRTIEQLIIFYEQPANPFLVDLIKINENILAKRG